MKPQRVQPGPGQESVWDYPRPPVLRRTISHVRVEFGGERIVDTRRAIRLLETSQPPAFYLPRDDVRMDLLQPALRQTMCEWKGVANYFDVVVGDQRSRDAAWTYPNPTGAYEDVAGHVAFYAQRVDACWVDDDQVIANDGDFYGGWITPKVVGPFKGAPGTQFW